MKSDENPHESLKSITDEKEKDYESYRDIEEGKSGAVLAYIPFLCFIPLVMMKDNEFALKHGKQGLLLLLIEIVAVIFLFPGISDFFWKIILIFCFITAILGIIYSLQGKELKIPYLSKFVNKFQI